MTDRQDTRRRAGRAEPSRDMRSRDVRSRDRQRQKKPPREPIWPKVKALNWYFITGFSFFLLVVGMFAYSGARLYELLNDAEAVPIEAVMINGDRHYTTDDDIRKAMESLMLRSFFSADVGEIQKTIKALPWVHEVSVRRVWPARIKVHLQEQKVAARWNGMDWLNESGEAFSAPSRPELEGLPKLSGPENMSAEVLKAYRQIEELLRINGFGLESLSLSPRHAWIAVLENGITLELGREDKMARIQRFINVYPTLTQQAKAVARVDLRYDTGLAVGWNETTQESR
ncbi:cell division protein FtsQ/DivIB [Shewanella jiangmenensis]